jgi:hypothetical protein
VVAAIPIVHPTMLLTLVKRIFELYVGAGLPGFWVALPAFGARIKTKYRNFPRIGG